MALFATLKAGAAYVPLDPSYPPQRLRAMLEDVAPRVIVTQSALRGKLDDYRGDLVLTDESRADIEKRDGADFDVPGLTSAHPAYLIFTSGSMGRPKAAVVYHSGLMNLAHWYVDSLGLSAADKLLVATSCSFDLTQKNLLAGLLSGGSVHLAPEPYDPRTLLEIIAQRRITAINLTPSAFTPITGADEGASLGSLRFVVLGGEPISSPHIAELWRRYPRLRVMNSYGPTECADVAAFHVLSAEDVAPSATIPLGRAIPSVALYILDQRGRLTPIGVPGELCIAGVGVGAGYVNRSDLTAERFVPNPFGEAGTRLYRTGDVARYRADGTIDYLGRVDHQVKIRGFRIELGEIEATLARVAQVREAIVVAREDEASGKRLVAYLTKAEGAAPDVAALRAALQRELPDYMVPSAIVVLDAIPLTPNGKIDRKALPAPDSGAQLAHRYVAPRNATEETLCRIWAEALGVERVGIDDNFFELGGHSLLAVTLIERLRREGLASDVRSLFAHPTPATHADSIGDANVIEVPPNLIPANATAIAPHMVTLASLNQDEIDRIIAMVPGGAANIQDIYPLAPLQEGILFHHMMAEQGDVYLTPILQAFDTRECLEAFLEALDAAIARHDILRTAVVWEGLSEPMQVVWREAPLVVEEVILDPRVDNAAAQLLAQFDPRQYRLNVRQAPMMRGFLACDRSQGRWLLLLLEHHLMSDHTTLEVVIGEIRAHKLGRLSELPSPLAFRDFVARARLGVSRAEHDAYFRARLADVEESTAPFGLLEAQDDGSGVVELLYELDLALSRRIRAQARKLRISAASLFHTAFALVVSRASGRDDVVFGTVLFGRMHGSEGVDRAVGIFINTLPVRARIRDRSAELGVREMQESLTGLLRHEHASLALAQRASGVEAPAPLFTALLNYRHTALEPETNEQAEQHLFGNKTLFVEERTNYPVSLSIDDFGERFSLLAQTRAPLSPELLCAFMRLGLENLVDALEMAPQTPLQRIEVMPADEGRRIVGEWNATAADYPRDLRLHELFEEQVERSPSAAAVVFEDAQLSYGELNAKANQLAHELRGRGVGQDAIVGLCVERSLEMIIGIFGVLKAGAPICRLIRATRASA